MNILQVDDELDILTLTKIVLELDPATTLTQCQSGSEALETLKDIKPDVMLLDLMMPGMTGEELFAEVRRKQPAGTVPVVFMTAITSQDVIDRLLESGAAGIIAKPFRPDTLATYLKDKITQAAEEH